MKEYLLMVDHSTALQMSGLFPGLKFVEVAGMDVSGSENKYKVLIAPLVSPVPEHVVEQPTETVDEPPKCTSACY